MNHHNHYFLGQFHFRVHSSAQTGPLSNSFALSFQPKKTFLVWNVNAKDFRLCHNQTESLEEENELKENMIIVA